MEGPEFGANIGFRPIPQLAPLVFVRIEPRSKAGGKNPILLLSPIKLRASVVKVLILCGFKIKLRRVS
jgi:hypothetical protein